MTLRNSRETRVKKVYENTSGKPGSHKAHHLLSHDYVAERQISTAIQCKIRRCPIKGGGYLDDTAVMRKALNKFPRKTF